MQLSDSILLFFYSISTFSTVSAKALTVEKERQQVLIHGGLHSKFDPQHLLSCNYIKLGIRSDNYSKQQLSFVADFILLTIHKSWLAQTEGWYSCYLKVSFNSPGSQASLRSLLTESTQRRAALQVINTLLTVVGGLLSSEQRTASWKDQLQTIPACRFRQSPC